MKKALLVNHQINIKGIVDWYSLEQYQIAKDLTLFLGKMVDILPWSKLNDFNFISSTYDTIIITESTDKMPYRNSKYKTFLFDTLKKFVGKKYCLNTALENRNDLPANVKDILHDYYCNNLNSEFNNFLNLKPNIVYGDNCSLSLWTPNTRVIVKEDFKFRTNKKYEDMTIFFSEYTIISRTFLKQSIENLFKRIVGVNSLNKNLVIPCSCDLYYDDLINLIIKYSEIFNVDLYKTTFNINSNPWKQTLWDMKKDEIKQNYLQKYEI